LIGRGERDRFRDHFHLEALPWQSESFCRSEQCAIESCVKRISQRQAGNDDARAGRVLMRWMMGMAGKRCTIGQLTI